jgi:hypothetical protein
LNSASGHKDSNAERQVLADVFNSPVRDFEFLQFDNPSNIASVSAWAAAGADIVMGGHIHLP